jgi:hypothetical protein
MTLRCASLFVVNAEARSLSSQDMGVEDISS